MALFPACAQLINRFSLIIWLILMCLDGLGNARYSPYYSQHRRRYELTLSIRNYNVTEAKFFRLVGVDNTADFQVKPGHTFTKTYEVRRRGYWTLFVEFEGDRYSRSPSKQISRDSFSHWVMEVFYYPGAVGFTEWHKMHSDVQFK